MNRLAVAEVIPLVSLPRHLIYFDYRVPADRRFAAGDLVRVNFRSRRVLGVIVKIKSSSELPVAQLSLVLDRLEGGTLTTDQLDFALRISRYYHVSPGIVLKSFVVPPLQKIVTVSGLKKRSAPEPRIRTAGSKAPVFIQYEQSADRNKYFIDLIKTELDKRQSVSVIFPEIREAELFFQALTPTLKVFASLVHGSLVPAAQRAIRQRIKHDTVSLVIGTTAALFEPVRHLGALIIDDESNDSYKQTDRQPHYHGRQLAIELTEITSIRLVLAGPLPSLEALDYLARKDGRWQRLADPRRHRPAIEACLISNNTLVRGLPFVTETLADFIKAGLAANRRCLIYHNRLGLASRIICSDCGWQPSCPVCHVGFKLDSRSLHCVSCGRIDKIPVVCPVCRGLSLKPRGLGVEKLKESFEKRWPDARVSILDDKRTIDHSSLVNSQIIIATSKVWRVDLPPIHQLAWLSLEAELNRSDWRGNEQVYRLLYKLAGLSPGHLDRLIIQTSHPESPLVRYFTNRADRAWLKSEQNDRTAFSYPPAVQLVKLSIEGRDLKPVLTQATILSQKLLALKSGGLLIDCSPPIIVPKIRRGIKWINLIVKLPRGLEPDERLRRLSPLGPDWYIDVDPINLD